ncbi:MAG: alpha-ketoacid dehydrogenase subunit beta [Spirochaetes bacterium]|nr:alpha-ketoacid dehydrogenase subunit beta [Spirochaetota bacterium]
MRVLTYREALREAIREEMARDESVFVMGEDVGAYGGAYGVTKGLFEEFGTSRIRDTPMSEAAIVGLATGAAIVGFRPVAEIMYIDFLTLAMDQLVNQAAKMRYMYGGGVRVPLVVRTQQGTGRSSAAQHSQSLEAWFIHVPGLTVVTPSTPYEAKGLLKAAIRDDNPVLFIEHKMLYNTKGPVPDGDYTLPLGRAEIKRSGKDVTVVAYSRMAVLAEEAAQQLAQEGVDLELIDPRTLNPLDSKTIVDSVRRTGRLVVVEEGCRTGGVGAEIVARVVEGAMSSLKAPPVRVAGLDIPIPAAPILEKAAVPTTEKIVEAIRQLVRPSDARVPGGTGGQ